MLEILNHLKHVQSGKAKSAVVIMFMLSMLGTIFITVSEEGGGEGLIELLR